MFWRLLKRLSNKRRCKIQAQATAILEQIMPSRPQVAAHQKSAALHLQLANEIGWVGARGRPQQWRGTGAR